MIKAEALLKLSILLITFFVLPATGSSQTWYEANNPYGANVIFLFDSEDGVLLCGTTRGLYKSSDNGENWISISGENDNFASLDATISSTGDYFNIIGYRLYRSEDEGNSWDEITSEEWTYPSRILSLSSGELIVNSDSQLWRSSDNGGTWSTIDLPVSLQNIDQLELGPDDTLVASTWNGTIIRSTDDGQTWTEQFTAANSIRSFSFNGDNVVYATTGFSGLYKSEDNGINWTELPELDETDGGIDIEAGSGEVVYLSAYDGGIRKSEDGGTIWTDITSNLIDPSIDDILITTGGDLFVGTSSGGVFKLQASDWEQSNQGISAIYIERFVAIDESLFACTSSGVFSSNDGGQTWVQSLSGMDETDILAIAKAPNGTFYAGGEMLYKSVDGVNWTNLSQAFPDSEVYVEDIWIDSDGRVILATEDYGIRYSDDEGSSWTYANSGLEDVTMNFIRKNDAGFFFTADGYNLYRTNNLDTGWEIINNGLSDTDIEEFLVASGGIFAVTYSDGTFRSTDNGDNWSLVIDEEFSAMTSNGSEIYGASENVISGGVYLSEDNGLNWSNLVNGLPNIQVEEVDYVQGQGLFANVRSFGLFTFDFSVMNTVNRNIEERLKIFPNPFDDEIVMTIDSESSYQASYYIFDLMGKILHSGNLNILPGRNEFGIGQDLNHGVYILNVKQKDSLKSIRIYKR